MKKKHFIDLGKRLRKARMTLGFQQKEMAKVIGVKPPYLSSIEKGKRTNPAIAIFFKISIHYQISIDYLLHGIGDMFLPFKEDQEKTPQDFSPDFNSIDDVNWLMKNSTFSKNAILSYVVRFYIENESFIKTEMMRSKGIVQEDVKGTGPGDSGENSGAEGSYKTGS
jgi:transcriptional regulator with XRE-family HTH domain